MARLPAHQVQQARQDLWDQIRRLKTFVRGDLEQAGGLSQDAIRDYLRGLVRAGYLSREEQGAARRVSGVKKRPDLYRLVRDIGIDAPRVRRDGSEVSQGRGREQMWRTLKIVGSVSAKDLAVQASTEEQAVSHETAKEYLLTLHRAGYLKCTQQPQGQKPGRYRLIPTRYYGPKPPQIQRVNAVYDPNLGRVVWTSAGGSR